jgi:hypothetical protein
MSKYLLYLGSVYRLADEATEREFFVKRHRYLSDADADFRTVLRANQDQLGLWAEEAKAALPNDTAGQVKYWIDKVKTLDKKHPVLGLVRKYGPWLQHPDTERDSKINKLKGKGLGDWEFARKKKEILDLHALDRAKDEDAILKGMAEFFLGQKSYEQFFGKRTEEKVSDPSSGDLTYVWDTTSGLVKTLEQGKKKRQVVRPMNPLFRRQPFLEQLMQKFFPKPVILSVTADNVLREELSVYGNKIKDEIHKTAVMSKTLASWNTLISALNRDMQSQDEFLRLVAIATSVVVHTGIRPAEKGESILRQNPETMPEAELVTDGGVVRKVKTVGSAGLKASHVEIIRQDLANLAFVGKYSTTNLATVSDAALVSALAEQVNNMLASGGGDIFIMKNGRHINDKHINEYLKTALNQRVGAVPVLDEKSGKWVVVEEKPITAYSYRRLIATQEFYDSLRERKPEMAAKLRELKIEIVEGMSRKALSEIKQRITDAVKAQVSVSVEDVRELLSHSEASEFKHAIGNYISHRVILEYLSRNGVMRSMEEIVGEGYSVKLQFDPIDFFKTMMAEYPVTAALIKAWQAKAPAQPGVGGTFVTRGPAMLPFAPDALIAWAENRKWAGTQAPTQEVMQLAAQTRLD